MPKKKRKNNLSSIEKKIDEVLALEKKQLRKEEAVTSLEKKQLKEQNIIEELEKKQLIEVAEEEKELRKIEKLEKEIRKEVGPNPLTRITIRDVSKGMIGAFIGIVSHFAFVEGAHLAETESFTYLRATVLLLSAFLIGLIFVYATGFRNVKEKTLVRFFPLRVALIYSISLLSIFIVLSLYGIIGYKTIEPGLVFKQVASISIPAIIGASAADLIGRE